MDDNILRNETISKSPDMTFQIGEKIGESLKGGEIVLLYGTMGAGKTLLTKGIVNAFGFDVDEVTSPSFTLVNLYKTQKFNVYHIDLWRIRDSEDSIFAVGLEEILEDQQALIIVEWAERFADSVFDRETLSIDISGDGDDPRTIGIARQT